MFNDSSYRNNYMPFDQQFAFLKSKLTQNYYSYKFRNEFKLSGGKNIIFCFHGFNNSFGGYNYGQTSKKFLIKMLSIISEKFSIVNFNTLLTKNIDESKATHHPMAAFTIDDGFLSVLNVLDVFKKYSVAPMVNVCPALIEREQVIFPELIRIALLITEEKYFHSPVGKELKSIHKLSDRIFFANEWIKYFKKIPRQSLENELMDFFNRVKVSESSIKKSKLYDPLMTYKQIKEILPYISIGSHTNNHLHLADQEDEISFNEISESKKKIEDNLGIECKYFVYPFGNNNSFGEREERYSESAGYLNAFSLQPGFINKIENIYNLPRVNIGGGFKYFLNNYWN